MTFLVDERVLRIIMHDTLLPTRKVIAQHYFTLRGCSCKFVVSSSKMSWAKASAEAGLAGLSEREAARGALCEEAFQMMPSSTLTFRPVVSKFKCRLIITNVTCIEYRRCRRCIFE